MWANWIGTVLYLCSLVRESASCSYCTIQPGKLFRVDVLLDEGYGINCSRKNNISVETERIEAIKGWASTHLTNTSGLEFNVLDTCSCYAIISKTITSSIPYHWVYDQYQYQSQDHQLATDMCVTNSSKLIGFVSQTQVHDFSLIRLLEKTQLPLVVASDQFVPPDLANSAIYGKGYTLETSIKMMFRLMIELEWDYVTVVYSDNDLGRRSQKIYKKYTSKFFVCTAKYIAASFENTNLSDIRTRGVVYLGTQSLGLDTISRSSSTDQVWVTSLSHIERITSDVKVYSVVRQSGDPLTDTLMSYLLAFNSTYSSVCHSSSASCGNDNLMRQTLISKINETLQNGYQYVVNKDGDITMRAALNDTVFDVIMVDKSSDIIGVAQISDKTGTVRYANNATAHIPKPSICTTDECRAHCSALNPEDFLYFHGDDGKNIIMITMSIKDGTNPSNPWTCTKTTAEGLFRVETAIYTITKLSHKLKNFNFGFLIVDSCVNHLKTARDVFGIVGGQRKNICERGDNSKCLDPDKIVIVIGDDSSGVSKQTILREIHMVQIGYGASSAELSDRHRFPYFLRTNAADNVQVHNMVKLLQQLGQRQKNDINAVSIVYSNSLYGSTAYKLLKEKLRSAGICIHMNLTIEYEYTQQDLTDILLKLLDGSGDVGVVIMFLDIPHISVLMDKLLEDDKLNSRWLSRVDSFTFVLSDSWNRDGSKLRKYGKLVKGSFTFGFNTDFKSDSFHRYLTHNRTRPSQIEDPNPFMTSLRQMQGQCKIRGNFLGRYTELCSDTHPINFTDLEDEQFSRHMMKAITAAVYGLRSFAYDNANDTLYRRDEKHVRNLYESILKIQIPATLESRDRNSGNPPFMDKPPGRGDGNVGYTVYQIRATEPSYTNFSYKTVAVTGSTETELLDLNGVVLEFYQLEHGSIRTTTHIRSMLPEGEACIFSDLPLPTTQVTTTREPCPAVEINCLNSGKPAAISVIVVAAIATLMILITVMGIVSTTLYIRLRLKLKRHGPPSEIEENDDGKATNTNRKGDIPGKGTAITNGNQPVEHSVYNNHAYEPSVELQAVTSRAVTSQQPDQARSRPASPVETAHVDCSIGPLRGPASNSPAPIRAAYDNQDLSTL